MSSLKQRSFRNPFVETLLVICLQFSYDSSSEREKAGEVLTSVSALKRLEEEERRRKNIVRMKPNALQKCNDPDDDLEEDEPLAKRLKKKKILVSDDEDLLAEETKENEDPRRKGFLPPEDLK